MIVFTKLEPGRGQLYSMKLDGSDSRWIELPSGDDYVEAYWTGFDGGIVMRLHGSSLLWVAPTTGGAVVPLTSPGIEDDPSDPQIAPDGSFLVYDAQITGADRETVVYWADPPDRDADGILDLCDCLPDDDSAGQSPGLVELRFDDASTLGWDAGAVATSWTVYRGDLSNLPGDAGQCVIEDHPSTSYTDVTLPLPGETLLYLVAGEGACGLGRVGPDSAGAERNVSCP